MGYMIRGRGKGSGEFMMQSELVTCGEGQGMGVAGKGRSERVMAGRVRPSIRTALAYVKQNARIYLVMVSLSSWKINVLACCSFLTDIWCIVLSPLSSQAC